MSAQRIQRKRTKGWRMPEGAVYVGRPTYWSNPWPVGISVAGPGTRPMTRDEVVDKYRRWLESAPQLKQMLAPLRGKDLACWCRLDQRCHADVLLELANR